MAKSLRSKHKRKMRAVKRIRYGEKELVKLKETVAKLNAPDNNGVDLSQLSDTVIVANAKAVVEAVKARDDSMETGENRKKYNKKTMKDEHGNYPPWYNKRKIKELQLKSQKVKKRNLTGKKKVGGKRRHR